MIAIMTYLVTFMSMTYLTTTILSMTAIMTYLVTLSPQNSVITVCPVTPSTFAVDL